MNSRPASRIGALAAALPLAAVFLAAPTAALAQATDGVCEITGGTLTWGVKESFRAYISGSIANGSWETSEGADYATPEFVWANGTGSFDPETGTGSVAFTGTVHFTGHDGVLDLTLANPTIEFEGGGSAALLLDARSTDMEGEVAVDATQEWVGEVALEDEPSVTDGTIELAELPTTLTNSGATAFAGFYEAGVELDPVGLVLEAGGCETSAAPEEVTEPETPETPVAVVAAADDEAGIPWLPIIVGGAALIVIGLTLGLLIGGRRPRSGTAATSRAEEDEAPETGAS